MRMLLRLLGISFSSSSTESATDIIKHLENERIEREIALQEAILERKNAYKLAAAQERFPWIACSGTIAIIMSLISSFTHKNLLHATIVPPLATAIAYEAHYCFGNKTEFIKKFAGRILSDNSIVPKFRHISSKELDERILAETES